MAERRRVGMLLMHGSASPMKVWNAVAELPEHWRAKSGSPQG